MSKHTQEPWQVHHDIDAGEWPMIMAGGVVAGKIIANVNPKSFCCVGGDFVEMPSADNARRIVACVNFCAGISTENLEDNEPLSWLTEQYNAVKDQRDELLAALQGMIDIANDSQGVAGYHLNGEVADWGEFEEWQAACDAIAKINGSAENHFPGAAKMVAHEGWQLVPVEPTPEMRQAGVADQAEKLKRYALGGSLPPIDHGIPDAYRAMLAAAPKHEGGAS